MKLDEVAPGIHRIESDIGQRFVAQYLLVGEERTVLVDTGLATTPDDALLPALDAMMFPRAEILTPPLARRTCSRRRSPEHF